MGYLPPVGWADVATKQDLAELRADMRTQMAELRAELHATITSQTRTLFLGLVGVMVAYSGGLVAAVHLR